MGLSRSITKKILLRLMQTVIAISEIEDDRFPKSVHPVDSLGGEGVGLNANHDES